MQHWEALEAIYWEAMLERERRQKWQESIVIYFGKKGEQVVTCLLCGNADKIRWLWRNMKFDEYRGENKSRVTSRKVRVI